MNIVFFDGACAFCHHFVDFLIHKDRKKQLFFSPLQGKTIQLGPAASLASGGSIVFVKGEKIYTKSRACIEIIATLGGIYLCVRALLLIPSVIRDGLYLFMARHRYRWLGKQQTISRQERFLP